MGREHRGVGRHRRRMGQRKPPRRRSPKSRFAGRWPRSSFALHSLHGSFRQAAKAKPGKNGLLGWNPSTSYQWVIDWLIGAAIIPSMVTLHSTPVHWAFTASPGMLDPARHLGELAELPSAAQPGEWCTIAAVDELGEIPCTFVAVEAERTSSLFVDRRGEAASPALPVGRRAQPVHWRAPGRVAEWDGTDGTAGPPRREEGGAAD